MNLIACDGTWHQSPEGYLTCSGTLQVVPHSGLTAEDAAQLRDGSIAVLVVVFGFLAIKKALNL